MDLLLVWTKHLEEFQEAFEKKIVKLFAKKTDVHNGTLKIQKNGTTVKTFTANQEGDVTADITVPVRVSELENDEGYARTESPVFTGAPQAPTPPQNSNDTRIATTAFVKAVINALVGEAPETLDTIEEIADALARNQDVVDALNEAIGKKVDKVSGKGLSSNDFTTNEKNKLAGISDRATANAPSQTVPKANGTAAAGTEAGYSRGDHVHPLQTSVSGNAGTADKWKTARKINGLSVQGDADRANYGTCSTAAATAAKTVACAGFALATGAAITVKFTVTNTAANPTLNVNNTGAKPVFYRGAAIAAGYLAANRTYGFRYNGTQWELVGDLDTNTNTTYGAMKGATASAAGTAGLAPAPPAGAQGKYLRGDGTYQTPPNTTYAAATATPKAPGTAAVGTSAKYAREDHVHPEQTTVSGMALKNETVPALNSAPTYNTLADFWTAFNNVAKNQSAYTAIMRFKSGSWTPTKSTWYRAIVSCQNLLANGSYDVTGQIILFDGINVYSGSVTGGKTGTSDLAVVWKAVSTGIEEATDADIDAIIAGTFK